MLSDRNAKSKERKKMLSSYNKNSGITKITNMPFF